MYVWDYISCSVNFINNPLQGKIHIHVSVLCRIHLDDVTAATGQRRRCAHHTHYRWRGKRDRANQVDGNY